MAAANVWPAAVSEEEVEHHEEVFEHSCSRWADGWNLHHVFSPINDSNTLLLLQDCCQVLLSHRKRKNRTVLVNGWMVETLLNEENKLANNHRTNRGRHVWKYSGPGWVLLMQTLISTPTQTAVHMLELNKDIAVLMVTSDILATLDCFFFYASPSVLIRDSRVGWCL